MRTIDCSRTATDEPRNEPAYGSRGGELTVHEVVFPPGDGIGPHVHPRGEDCALVLSGTLDYRVEDGERLPTRPGEFVLGRRNAVHGYAVRGDAPVHLLVFTAPGRLGLAYPGPDDPSVRRLPREERRLTPPDGSATTEFSTAEYVAADGTYAEPREPGVVRVFADWERKRVWVFDDEPVEFEAAGRLLRYTAGS